MSHLRWIEEPKRGLDGRDVPTILGTEQPEVGPNHVILKRRGILDKSDRFDVEFLRNLFPDGVCPPQPFDAHLFFGRFRHHKDLGKRLAHLQSGVLPGGSTEAHDSDHRSHISHKRFVHKRFVRFRIVAEVHALGEVRFGWNQVLVDLLGQKRQDRSHDLDQGHQRLVQRSIGGCLIGVVLTFPETPTASPDVPIG